MNRLNTTKMNKFSPLSDNILVTGLEEGMKMTRGGIIRLDDNFKEHGIRPRWAQVWQVGPNIDYVKVGEWVYVEHGRWTLRIPLDLDEEGQVDVWKIDPAAILLVSDVDPLDSVEFNFSV